MSEQRNPAYAFVAMGFELVGLIIASLYLGQWIDERYGIWPWGTLGLVLVGVIGWMVHIFLLIQQIDRHSGDS